MPGEELLGRRAALEHDRGRPADQVEDGVPTAACGQSTNTTPSLVSSRLSERTSPCTSVGPRQAAGQPDSSSASAPRWAARPGVEAGGRLGQGGQLGPAAEEFRAYTVAGDSMDGAGLGVSTSCRASSASTHRLELAALPRMARRSRRRRPRRPGPPSPRRRRCRATAGSGGIGAARPDTDRLAPVAAGESGFSSAPTALTKMARSGHSRTEVAPGEKPPGRSRTASGGPPPTPAAHACTASGTCGPRQVDAGRRAGGGGHEAAAPAAASASLMLSTSRRADSALSSTATRAPGPRAGSAKSMLSVWSKGAWKGWSK